MKILDAGHKFELKSLDGDFVNNGLPISTFQFVYK